ncbi:auxin efflux carrier [Suillus bovinus]|uniref:auxin efflux carrier n=1 Tax=Suillus bovinus TaxID=48563 RepID=UPI001B886384|nr:auxin efflux carrier [Suillus bovinus]KAG2136363.1 auxin efflux carrier [Suillus bovinus]
MANISFGTLLWVAVRPLLRLFICVACGYGITRAGFFPAIATRGAVQVVLNVTLPSLMFSRALSALNAKNDAAFGPLIVIALIYMAIGFTLSLFIKRFFWVPYRFRYGILVAGGWASSCDITMSVMTDIMASLPFNSVYDQDLAVTYVSAFCVIFYLTILTCGRNLIERDFIGPDTSDEQAKSVSSSAAEKNNDLERNAYSDTMSSRDLSPQLSSLEHSLADSPSTSTIVQHDTPSGICNDSQSSIDAQPHTMPPSTENSSHNKPRPAMRYVNLLCNLSFPVLLSVVISLVVSRISALKALFIPNVSGTNVPPAPDGQPPLAFIMDTAAYLGAASSPIGLIILGSAIARMSIPRGRWTALPLRAIVTLAVGKQLIMPVLGVLICEGFTQIGFIHAEDKVLRFVCIFVSCLPIASSQVILTQAFSDATTTDHLVAFLLPQLILMPGVMAVLMAFTLNLLFG